MKIFAINPGSTTTKTALFLDDRKLLELSVTHDADTLRESVPDQLPRRAKMISQAMEEAGQSLLGIDAFAGRGGGGVSCEAGVYAVNARMLQDARMGLGALHPSSLGSQLADAFAGRYGGRAFVVNPVNVDEMLPQSRLTGLKGLYRSCHLHALNQKEVALRHAARVGRRYEEMNLVIAHIGGGITVTAHRRGRMIDSSDGIEGDGPMAPTRAGSLPGAPLVSLCFEGGYTKEQLLDRFTRDGGWMDHLGTSDTLEVKRRIAAGDGYAELVYRATIHQIAKAIGAYAAVLCGQVDAVLLTGGIARDEDLVSELERMIGFIAPVAVYPGEFELEALAGGALRVLRGEEPAKEYTGIPVWTPEDLPKAGGI
ncbi:MAG: butyrate kinase [Christensenellales bacterium]